MYILLITWAHPMGPAFTAGLGPSQDPLGPTITAAPLPEPPWAKLYKLLLAWDIFLSFGFAIFHKKRVVAHAHALCMFCSVWFDFGVFVASSVVWFGRVPIYI